MNEFIGSFFFFFLNKLNSISSDALVVLSTLSYGLYSSITPEQTTDKG